MSLTATAEKTATAGDKPVPLPQLPEQGTTGKRDNDSPASRRWMSFPGLVFGNLLATPTGRNIGGDWRSPPNQTQATPSIAPSTPMIRVPTQAPLPRKAGTVTFLDQGQHFQAQVPEKEDGSEDSEVEDVDPMEAIHALEDNIWDPSPLTNLDRKSVV